MSERKDTLKAEVFISTVLHSGVAKAAEYAYDNKDKLSANDFEHSHLGEFCEYCQKIYEYALKVGHSQGRDEGYQEGYRYGFSEGSGVDVSDLEEAWGA